MAKYNAKFRLLEYGLLDDAQKVDELTRQVRFREKAPRDTKGKGKAAGEGEEEEEEEEVVMQGNDDVEDETEVAFLTRLELFVMVTIARQVAVGAKRGSYKDGLVYQYRKDLITEFLKATILNKCQNCRMYVHSFFASCKRLIATLIRFAYSFRKEGHTKVIEYDLSVKQKKSISKKRPDVLTLEKTIAHAAKHKADVALQEIDEDAEMMSDPADSEGEGDSIGEEDEEEEGDDAEEPKDSDGKPLPRAANGKVKTKRGRNERVMAAEECRAHLRRLFRNESAMCALLYGKHSSYAKVNPQGYCLASADMFFLDVIPVAPTRFRPPAKMNEILFEHPQNELLARVLNTAYRLRDLNIDLRTASQKGEEHDEEKRKKVMEQLLAALIQLQVDVNSFMDSSKNPQPVRQGKLPPAGVKQGLEKKEGLFRKHMMVCLK